ncbi:MAG: M28 family peptidase [Promethearchaeota archaeon]
MCTITFALLRAFIISILGVLTQESIAFYAYLLASLFPLGFIFAFFFTGTYKNGGTVPGATDNLTSVAISIALGRIIRKHPELIPKNTEIRVISFGSEEAAVRGSTNYVKTHLNELKKNDLMVLNFESICDPNL